MNDLIAREPRRMAEALQATSVTPPGEWDFLWALLALLVGLTGLVSGLGLSALTVLAQLVSPRSELPTLTAVTFAGLGLLGVPLIWRAGQRLRGLPSPLWQTRRAWLVLGVVVTVLALGLGQLSLSFDLAPSAVLGPVQFLAVLAPAMLLVTVAADGWAGFSPLRAWGHLISGGWLATTLAFIVEVVVISGLLVVSFALLAALAPNEFQELTRLFQTFRVTQDPGQLTEWLYKPWVIAGSFFTASILLPAIEEILKPLGVIPMLRRGPTPMAAFLGGVMGGVGFAVVESLLNLGVLREMWLALVVARMGTMVMHGLTSGLVGWGWGQLALTRRPWWLLAAYLAAVFIHGVWNAGAVALAFSGTLLQDRVGISTVEQIVLGGIVLTGLLLLAGISLAGVVALGLIGYRLRQEGSRP